jgi:hypothetical protein
MYPLLCKKAMALTASRIMRTLCWIDTKNAEECRTGNCATASSTGALPSMLFVVLISVEMLAPKAREVLLAMREDMLM